MPGTTLFRMERKGKEGRGGGPRASLLFPNNCIKSTMVVSLAFSKEGGKKKANDNKQFHVAGRSSAHRRGKKEGGREKKGE